LAIVTCQWSDLCFLFRSIGFFQGDIKLLMDDIATLRPTVFPVVPRLLNRIYDKVALSRHKYDARTVILNLFPTTPP